MTALNSTEIGKKISFTPHWQGTLEYQTGLARQHEKLEAVQAGDRKTVHVLGMEHQTVITLGRRASLATDVEQRSDAGIPVLAVERGGQATLHSPGQVVIYPVLHLPTWGLGVREWTAVLLDVTAQTLLEFGVTVVPADPNLGVGLWTDHGKIAFLGLRVVRGFSTHGLAINVNNDLGLAQAIRSCGVAGARWDKVERVCPGSTAVQFFAVWARIFESHLEKNT